MEIQNLVVGDLVRWVPKNKFGCNLHSNATLQHLDEVDETIGTALYEIVEILTFTQVVIKRVVPHPQDPKSFHDDDGFDYFNGSIPVCSFHLRREENERFDS